MYSLFGGHDGIRVKLLEVIKKYMRRAVGRSENPGGGEYKCVGHNLSPLALIGIGLSNCCVKI